MGTISSVQVSDPIHWPNSPWRLLQVAWDEPDLLQNVKRVSPWLAELVSHMPAIHLSPFSPPRKKLRLPHPDFPLVGQIPMPSFPSNPLRPSSTICCIPDNISAGIQGARHAHYGLSSSDLHFNKLQLGLFPVGFQQLDYSIPPSRIPSSNFMGNRNDNEDLACLLTMGNSSQNMKKDDNMKTPVFLLFGKPILTEEQISQSSSGDTVGNSSSDENPEKTANFSDGSGSGFHQNGLVENSSDDGFPWYKSHSKTELKLETSKCKVFMESEDVGQILDLSVLGSYEELYRKLAKMFSIEGSEMLSNVMYQDTSGVVKHIGDEPFSEFLKTARRLTILSDSSSDNIGG